MNLNYITRKKNHTNSTCLPACPSYLLLCYSTVLFQGSIMNRGCKDDKKERPNNRKPRQKGQKQSNLLQIHNSIPIHPSIHPYTLCGLKVAKNTHRINADCFAIFYKDLDYGP
ncbi:hypothetical protein V6Z11_A10G118300 [Gossypium hirsutum]